MKIAVIDAGTGPAESLAKAVAETLTELGEEAVMIKLNRLRVPYYGTEMTAADEAALNGLRDVVYEITSCAGAVFVVPAIMGGPSALMKAFLEHFSEPQFQNALMDKNCMVVAASFGIYGGVRETLEYMSRAIAALGGYDANRTGVPEDAGLPPAELRLLIEKQTEDYYRILRQNRRFPPLTAYAGERGGGAAKQEPLPREDDPERFREFAERIGSKSFTREQEDDISEITRAMTERFDKPAPPPSPAPVRPRRKTCKQLTASLSHYFNPQIAAGLSAVVALNITGEEVFSGTILIDGPHCVFEEGAPRPESEILINSDSKVWTDILTGKYTAQKAFMVGQLKVRGNFLLLTKLDQLFSKMDA